MSAKVIPIRENAEQPDDLDPKRIALVHARWHAQDAACMERDRQVELAIRMLAGRQWDTWSEKRGKFVDPLAFMDEQERRWRTRPVYDFLGLGAQLTVAKLTESPPVIAFEPSTADRSDAELAEVCDTVFKTVSYDAQMDACRERAMWWAFVAGQAFYKSRAEYDEGEEVELAGPAVLSMDGADGQSIERVAERVPYGPDGSPLGELTEDGEGYSVPDGVEPHRQAEGKIAVDVLCPLEVRSEWTDKPLEQKRWVIHRTYLTSAEVEARYGVTVKPDMSADNASGGYLERMKRGAGYFGGVFARAGMAGSETNGVADGDGYVTVDEMWEKPCPGYPNGRLLAVTKDRVLLDAPRPFATEGAGPFREIACMRQPGRMFPSTPFEVAIPLQKAYNRLWAHIHEHGSKSANPIRLIDDRSGIEPDDVTNAPGLTLAHHAAAGTMPLTYAAAPALSGDIWKALEQTREQLLTLVGIPGSQGTAPTADASGELVEQLRFNADRAVSGIAHGGVRAEAGVARDWLAMLPSLWTNEKILTYAGEDSVARTVTVLPEMFDGSVNVRPILESALPETRAEKRARVKSDYDAGIFGMPGTPQAVQWYQQNVGYPNLNRAWRPGGVDRMTAERNLNQLVRGMPSSEILLFEQYDFPTHIQVTRDFIAAPEFLKLDPAVQNEILAHMYVLQGAAVAASMNQQRVAGAVGMAHAALGAQQQAQGQALLPPGAPPSEGAPNGPPESTAPEPAGPHAPGAQAA